ncbi:acyl-CoA/acyl-ACP dehydrogenase [Lysinibacillus xylanilyticus]|uniref:acyl-CoA dehydrogenase family protein n=1 Tax=Lysinibacillus xylanilyticus TaxID=582475 RepID=UPI002B250125|nr:acyl-CoA dehydrogenase family protein [Lysinibacillus xylanilyticus]MEB2281377.1 acyl-CoA/acyl-ACP dehydrogenase [Lysinibacillus xylanilyticus]
MSEMKDMILDVVERMLKEKVDKELVDTVEQGNWAPELWDLFKENGMTAVAITEENGGAGGDIEDLLNIVRLTGKYAAPIPFAETTFANYLLEFTSLEVIEDLATYMLCPNQAFTLENGKLTGEASHIPWARHTKHLVTIAYSTEGTHLVEIDLNQAEIKLGSNLAGEPRDTVIFHHAKVSQVSAVLSPDKIHAITTLNTAFQLAPMTGAVDKINDLTVQYTKEREQFGRPIHRFQLVQQHIVHLAGETAIALAAFNNVTEALLKNNQNSEVAYACIRFEEIIQAVTTIAHQVHAAIGTTHEHSLHQFTRRLWSWRDEGASTSYWTNLVATQLLENSGDSLWGYLTSSSTSSPLLKVEG